MRILRPHLAAAALTAALAFAVPASASDLTISIDKSAQKMTVSVDGEPRHVWPVSTGKNGYDTPGGDYKPFRMEKDHFSREWDDAPMPYSIFFTKIGHAIHGTYETKNLGRPASHGCVRLSRAHAAMLWALVKEHKMANTRVVLTGEIPVGGGAVARRQRAPSNDGYYDDESALMARRAQRRGLWREYDEGDRAYYYYERSPRYYGQSRNYQAPRYYYGPPRYYGGYRW